MRDNRPNILLSGHRPGLIYYYPNLLGFMSGTLYLAYMYNLLGIFNVLKYRLGPFKIVY